MEVEQFIADEERPVRSVDSADGSEIVADLGEDVEASVDVVGETAIVVRDDEELDLELPAGAERAFISNGILTIELEDES